MRATSTGKARLTPVAFMCANTRVTSSRRWKSFLIVDCRTASQVGLKSLAIERCAWLAWNLDSRGLDLCFRSQGISLEVPGQGEVYELLAWLALTEPILRWRPGSGCRAGRRIRNKDRH